MIQNGGMSVVCSLKGSGFTPYLELIYFKKRNSSSSQMISVFIKLQIFISAY